MCAPGQEGEAFPGGEAKHTNFISPAPQRAGFRRGLFPTDWMVTIFFGLTDQPVFGLVACCVLKSRRDFWGVCHGGSMGC